MEGKCGGGTKEASLGGFFGIRDSELKRGIVREGPPRQPLESTN